MGGIGLLSQVPRVQQIYGTTPQIALIEKGRSAALPLPSLSTPNTKQHTLALVCGLIHGVRQRPSYAITVGGRGDTVGYIC
jgi:hypothetical protein